MPAGRPSKYKPEYLEQAKKLCALGATDKAMADFFNTSEQTFNAWKKAHPEFLDALKVSKKTEDERVEKSLFHRALGYYHDDIDIRVVAGEIVKTPIVKHYPPDTTAAIFWLKNRKPVEWREKQEVEHSGSVHLSLSEDDAKL